MLIRPWR